MSDTKVSIQLGGLFVAILVAVFLFHGTPDVHDAIIAGISDGAYMTGWPQ